MRNAFIAGTCFVGLAFSFTAGCKRQTRVESAVAAQTLYMSVNSDAPDLDPHTNISGAVSDNILPALFDGLVVLGNDGKTILPGIAERWEVSPDGLVYTFHLRNAKWSNGDDISAQDFLFSFRRIFDPLLASESASNGFAIKGSKDFAIGKVKDPGTLGIAAPDAKTFVITLEHPAGYFLSLISGGPFYPVHLASLEKFNGLHQRGSGWTRPGNMVSNGAFVLKEWISNKGIKVVRNPNYWAAGEVKLTEINFIPIEDEPTEEHAFRAGQLHVTYGLPAAKIAAYKRDHPGELHIAPWLRTQYITFNTEKPPFNDPRIRKAFSLAIDRERLCSAVLQELGSPAHSMTRPGTGEYTPSDSALWRFDPAESRRLLADAGFSDVSKLPPVELMLSTNQGYVLNVGDTLQEMWSHNLGLKISVLPTEFKVYLEAERTKNFHFVLESWAYSADDPWDPLQLGSKGNPNNDSAWSSATYDNYYAAAEEASRPEVRFKNYDSLEELLAQEAPYAPLYFVNDVRLVHPLVKGWKDNPVRRVYWRSVYLER